jgi:signal transduction histidine kinase
LGLVPVPSRPLLSALGIDTGKSGWQARETMDMGGVFGGLSGRHLPTLASFHEMSREALLAGVTELLVLIVALGLVAIAMHWRRIQDTRPPSSARTALEQMKRTFLFCGIGFCVFVLVQIFWPAWRLSEVILALLALAVWRYARRARGLEEVYQELSRVAELEKQFERARSECKRKSEFLNAISHDLKSPLNGIMLQAELAELTVASNDPESLLEAIVAIKSCARTTSDLLNRFLEIGRLEWAGEPSKIDHVDLGDLCRQVASQARVRADRKGLRLLNECPFDVAVPTDRVKLERILFNLVDNAIKFTHQGTVRVHAEVDKDRVEIHVEDTGVGITRDNLGRIFDDFTQVNNRERDSRKGFGLGLAIARRLARQIGGDLTVESQPGRGSRFTTTLPAAEPATWNTLVASDSSRTVGHYPALTTRGY